MRRPLTIARLIGEEIRLWHPAWLCVAAALALTFLGLYGIDLGERLRGPDRAALEAAAGALEPAPGFDALSQPDSAGEGWPGPLTARQALHGLIGLVAAAMVALPHQRFLRLIAWPGMGLSLCLLVFLLVPWVPASVVRPVNGVRGWIDLGPMDLQPSELAKPAFALAMAQYLRYRKNHRTYRGLLPPAVITFIPVGLIFLQPDLGVAMLYAPALLAMLLAAGARLRHMAAAVAIGLCAIPASYPLLKPHQQQRIVGMYQQLVGDESAREDLNYQAHKAQMLVGAGGMVGNTDAHARAVVRFAELPERHNDMIFAVLMARFGVLGGAGIVALYGVWIAGAALSAVRTRDAFGRVLVVGLASFVAVQAVVNISMVVGAAPIIGITLPFVSYGGSSMLSSWVMVGLIFGVAMRPPPILSRPAFEFGDRI